MNQKELIELAIEHVRLHGGTIVVEDVKITIQGNGVICIMFNV